MIYHLLSSNVYMDRFIDFMEFNKSKFDNRHCYVFTTNEIYKKFNEKSCTNCYKLIDIIKLFVFSKKNDRFILHSYSHPWLYLVSFITFWNLKKIVWVIWGGDLYFYNEKKSIKYKIYEFLRRNTIRKFGYILALKGDYELAKKYYKIRGKYLFAPYPLDIYEIKPSKTNSTINILLGNSADPSNEHLELLRMLFKYKNEDIKIYVPLSYGGTLEYKNEVERRGIELYENKIYFIKDYMSINEYINFLSKINVLVCYHNRQQALGNIYTMLRMGKKVYIRDGITTCELLKTQGLYFFTTQTIVNTSFEEFIHLNDFCSTVNSKKVKKLYSNKILSEKWLDVYNAIV